MHADADNNESVAESAAAGGSVCYQSSILFFTV